MITLRSISGLSSISADSIEVAGLNGNSPISLANGEVAADKYTSYTTDADVLLEPNGAGRVAVLTAAETHPTGTYNVIESSDAKNGLLMRGNAGDGSFALRLQADSFAQLYTDIINGGRDTSSYALTLNTNGGLLTLASGATIPATKSLKTDTVTATTTNGDLTLSGNGTGDVSIAAGQSLAVDTITSKSTNSDLLLNPNGSGHVTVQTAAASYPTGTYNVIESADGKNGILMQGNTGDGSFALRLQADSFAQLYTDIINGGRDSSSYALTLNTNGGLLTLASGATIPATKSLKSDTVVATTTNGDLSLAGNGTGDVAIGSDLVVAASKLVATDLLTATTTNGDISIYGNGTGKISADSDLTVAATKTLRTDTLSATTTNGDLSVSGNGTGFVRIARQPCGFFERITSNQSVGNSSITTVDFNSTVTSNFMSIASGVVTVQKAGIYNIDVNIAWATSAAVGRLLTSILVNGTNKFRNEVNYTATSGNPTQNVSGNIVLAANDQVRVDVFQNSGLSASVTTGSPCSCLSIVYLCD